MLQAPQLTIEDIRKLLEDQEVLDIVARPPECRTCGLLLLRDLYGNNACPECDSQEDVL